MTDALAIIFAFVLTPLRREAYGPLLPIEGLTAERIIAAIPVIYAVALVLGLVILVAVILWQERRDDRRRERDDG